MVTNLEANSYTQIQNVCDRHNFMTWHKCILTVHSKIHLYNCNFLKMTSSYLSQHAEYNMTKHVSIGVIQHLFGHNYLLISVITMISLIWFYSK